jgi:hypothetical protein
LPSLKEFEEIRRMAFSDDAPPAEETPETAAAPEPQPEATPEEQPAATDESPTPDA